MASLSNNDGDDLDLMVSTGRVVRLEFSCMADLPMGSTLRVTGSSLWAPTSVGTPSDPMNAHHISQERQSEAFPALGGDAEELDYWYHHPTNLYASSVEMVTTPETYPLWKTKQPVIVVLHHTSSQLQHHYYRYLVVTPGASIDTHGEEATGSNVADMDTNTMDTTGGPFEIATTAPAHTSNTSPVMMWEHPFGDLKGLKGQSKSVASFATCTTRVDEGDDTLLRLAQLPYRTLDINVETLQVSPAPEDRLDTWNNPEDATFQAFHIRESMSQSEIKEKKKGSMGGIDIRSNASLTSDDASMIEDDDDEKDPSKLAAPRILFICFHLPVVVVKVNGVWQATWSESLLAQKEGSKIVAAYRAHWIGTVTPHPPISCEEDRQAVRQVLAELNCTPIFLNPSTRQAHYYGFCKQVLWPAFHNIDLLDLSTSGVVSSSDPNAVGSNSDWDQSRLDHWWQAYQQVNQAFSEVVNDLCDRDSSTYLWIHDYHLSLLPRYLDNREPGKSCRKVFFLHIPFPTSQIFRELECGEEILQGMLHADVVGFHAFDHARHFLNAGKRILGLNYESLVGGLIGVDFLGKKVLVSMSNVSIEAKMCDGT